MTDDTPAPVVSLADRRKPVTITPAPHLHVGFRTPMSDTPNDPLPLILNLEHQGEVVGEIARFTAPRRARSRPNGCRDRPARC
ncbi:MAG: hypothetical protein MIN69_16755 [Methylorubrum extorquens]|jgi:hypothetical protein|uniref:hypothetical protein n=1 Tax=Methylorubrum extorquens TaxID=408 RepID=UPI001EE5472B|nr:hypothetical protein [Methylorubrum extorquens]MCG5249669.1 hypothetical protein [Methylorubrum extorquens]